MTIVAAWLSELGTGGKFIECASDSRVTEKDPNSVFTLLNSSAKIFSIPVIAKHPGESGFFDTVYHVHSIGLAFCGSSLIGLNLSSSLSSIVSQLASPNAAHVPKLEDLCALAVRITSRYVISLANANNKVPEFKSAVLGWCPVTNSYQLISFGPRSPEDPTIDLNRFDLAEPGAVFLMGDRIPEIQEKIHGSRQGLSGIAWDIAPLRTIERVILDKLYPTIGGGLQHGRGTPFGFNLVAACQPVEPGFPQADISFRGLSIFKDIGMVGPCFVSMDMSA